MIIFSGMQSLLPSNLGPSHRISTQLELMRSAALCEVAAPGFLRREVKAGLCLRDK